MKSWSWGSGHITRFFESSFRTLSDLPCFVGTIPIRKPAAASNCPVLIFTVVPSQWSLSGSEYPKNRSAFHNPLIEYGRPVWCFCFERHQRLFVDGVAG